MKRRILGWLIQAAIVGIGYEAGKDLYYWIKGKKEQPTPRSQEQPPPTDGSETNPSSTISSD